MFCGFRFSFCLMHCPIRMIRRSVSRIQLKWFHRRRIDNIVISTSRHHNSITVTDKVLFFLTKDELSITLLDSEKLVNFWVHLVADFLAKLQTH